MEKEQENKKEEKEEVEVAAPVNNPTEEEILKMKDQLEELQKKNESLNELLLQVADKKQLAIYYQKHQEKIPPVVKLRTINGKVIVGWRTIQNEVYQDANTSRWVEKQIVEILFEDGTSNRYNLMDYTRLYQYINATVLATEQDQLTGDLNLKVKADNGKEYTIGVQYVN